MTALRNLTSVIKMIPSAAAVAEPEPSGPTETTESTDPAVVAAQRERTRRDVRFSLAVVEPARQAASFAHEVRAGLTTTPKRLPCRFFYDAAGSELFEEICRLPEYYVTRAEHEILAAYADEIATNVPPETILVELGSGSAAKTRLLIEALLRRQATSPNVLRYVPVDISRSTLEDSARRLLAAYPRLVVDAVEAEYHDALRYLRSLVGLEAGGDAGIPKHGKGGAPKLVLWLGSNVGNLTRDEAAAFLRRVRQTMGQRDRLLIGIDRRKDRTVLEPAYDDAQGVTARFNKNLLARINRELCGQFDLAAFAHRTVYHESEGRIVMELVSHRDQLVHIGALEIDVPFGAGESIHTEDSYKYSDEEIHTLAAAAGFAVARQWYDTKRRFSECLFRPLPTAHGGARAQDGTNN
jgi:L-histidine Nalpha-methyltransferase